jgi:hypothetical protein
MPSLAHASFTRTGKIRATILLSVAVLMCICAQPLSAAPCPPGSEQISIDKTGDTVRTTCKCLPDYEVHDKQCVLKLPEVDPAFFVSDSHVQLLHTELAQFRARKARLRKQIDDLNALRDRQDDYLREMAEMRQQLVFDGVSDLLQVAGTPEFLGQIPNLSATDAEAITRSTALMKAAVDTVSHLQAGADRERAREKAADAAGKALGLLANILAPPRYKEALEKLIETSAEMLKTVDAIQSAAAAPTQERVAKALDGIAGMVGAVSAPIGAARAGVDAFGTAVTIYHIENDKQSIIEALVSSQRAKLAADQRLAATDQMIAFYEVELQKSGRK